MLNEIKVKKVSKSIAKQFVTNHYQIDSEPYIANCSWYGGYEKGRLVAVCGVEFYNKELVFLKHLVVDKYRREEKIGTNFMKNLLPMLKTIKVKKAISHIYTTNFVSLFGALKAGFVVEGLMKDNDKLGSHVYSVGKRL